MPEIHNKFGMKRILIKFPAGSSACLHRLRVAACPAALAHAVGRARPQAG